MILKSFEEKKINLINQKIHLLYGENQGQINDFLKNVFKKNFKDEIFTYDEVEVIKNENLVYEKLQTKSFFDEKKLIIINRSTDKIKNLIEDIILKNFDDVNIVLISNILEKKSKLRSFFEKNKELVCIPFYKDTEQTLINLVTDFCKDKKINISRHNINLIIKRSMNDRQSLKNELQKIETFFINKKQITEDDILKITNLAENYSISELIDNCLVKNKKKITEILNENNFSIDECIQIVRIFLIKAKKLLSLSIAAREFKSIDKAISSHKPPIFWKDKDMIKNQLRFWTEQKIKDLIVRICELELLIKKNSMNSINILLDFILQETSVKN
jgi:DNA polymerase-3 subunit delta